MVQAQFWWPILVEVPPAATPLTAWPDQALAVGGLERVVWEGSCMNLRVLAAT